MSISVPDGAFYVLVDIRKLLGGKYKTSMEWTKALLESESVATVPGEAFFASGYVRISFSAGMAVLKKGIEKISKFVTNK